MRLAANKPKEIGKIMNINGIDSGPSQIRYSQLSHNEKIDMRINQLFAREDRNTRRELLQANMAFKSSLNNLKTLTAKGANQSVTSGNAQHESISALTLSSGSSSSISELANISDGNFTINGQQITVDTNSDTLDSIISKINSADPNITASYNSSTQKFELSSSNDIVLSNGSSNFFDAVSMPSGKVSSGSDELKASFYKNDKFREAINQFARNLNKILKLVDDESVPELKEEGEGYIEDLKEAVKKSINNIYDEEYETESYFRTSFGLSISFNGEEFFSFSEKEFNKSVVKNYNDIENFLNTFSEDGSEGGLLEQLEAATTKISNDLNTKIDSFSKLGLLVNTVA